MWTEDDGSCRRRFIGADFYRDEIDFGPLPLVGATSVASFLLLKTFNSLYLVTELAGNQSGFCSFGLFRPLSPFSRNGSFCSTAEAGKDVKHLQPSRIDVTYSTFDSSRFLSVQLLLCLSSFSATL